METIQPCQRPKTPSNALSPYAGTKRVNELYAAVFARCYGLQTVGMRYFNVFGPRQDPDGPYAAVIPRWIRAMIRGEAVEINGDGETTRDFREGDVQHSLADISLARKYLGYEPSHHVASGLRETFSWYVSRRPAATLA